MSTVVFCESCIQRVYSYISADIRSMFVNKNLGYGYLVA